MTPKKMIYSKFPTVELIATDEYKGYEYAVVNYGTHPCCYVKLYRDHPFFGHDHNRISLSCHGGLTYSKNHVQAISDNLDSDGWWIGWDYAHAGDYVSYFSREEGINLKRWSTEELIEDCQYVIDQVVEAAEEVVEQ